MVTEWKDTVPGPRDLPWTHKTQSLVKPSLRSSQRAAEKRQAQDRPRAQREHSAGSRGEKCLLFKPQAKPFVEVDERPLKGNWRLHCDTWMCSALISWAGRTAYPAPGRGGRTEEGRERQLQLGFLTSPPSAPCGAEGSPPAEWRAVRPQEKNSWHPAKIVGGSGGPLPQGGDGGPAWSLSPAWSLWSYTRIPIGITEEVPLVNVRGPRSSF